MGKRKIEIAKIDDKKKIDVTFSKRRKGLFSKAMNTGVLCNAKIAMVIFSPAGNPYTFATPDSSVDSVIDQYLSNRSFKAAGSAKEGEPNSKMFSSMAKEITETEWEGNKEGEQLNQCSCEGKEVGSWWDLVDVDGYSSVGELQILRSCLEDQMGNVCQSLLSLSSQVTTTQPIVVDDAHAERPALLDDAHAERPALLDDADLPFLVDDFFTDDFAERPALLDDADLPFLVDDFFTDDFLAEQLLGIEDENRF